MTFIDLIMVGELGNNAVATLGLAGVIHLFVMAFLVGIAPAVQGIVSRRAGERSTEAKCLPLNGGMLLALIIGLPITLIYYLATPFIFSLVSSDEQITNLGIPYLKALSISIVAIGIVSAFEAYWTGIAKVKICMFVSIITNLINILLNYIFIYGEFGAPALGVTGAGIASTLSVYISVLIYCAITFFYFKNDGFLTVKPRANLLIQISNMGLPVSMQQIFFAAGSVVLFWMYGSIGASELAAASILIRVSMIMMLVATALGKVSGVLVSNSLGQGDVAGAVQWGWDTGKLGVFAITLMGLPLFIFPGEFLSLFLKDAHAVEIAIIPLQLTALTTGLVSLSFIFATTLFSIGDGSRVMIASFGLRWFLFIPVVWLVGPYLNYGLLQVWIVQVVYGLILVAVITAIWIDGRWKHIKL